jgi:hypothetical protein
MRILPGTAPPSLRVAMIATATRSSHARAGRAGVHTAPRAGRRVPRGGRVQRSHPRTRSVARCSPCLQKRSARRGQLEDGAAELGAGPVVLPVGSPTVAPSVATPPRVPIAGCSARRDCLTRIVFADATSGARERGAAGRLSPSAARSLSAEKIASGGRDGKA